jgi:hypothetical protein
MAVFGRGTFNVRDARLHRFRGSCHDDAMAQQEGNSITKNRTQVAGAVQGLSLIVALAAVVLFGWIKPNHLILGEVLTACIATLVLFRFGDVTKFKALGVELEVAARKAAEATEQAKASTAQLRTLAASVGKLELDNLALRSRLGSLPLRAKAAIRDQLVEALAVAGCSADDLERAAKLLNASFRFDLTLRIGDPASKALARMCDNRYDDERLKTFGEKWQDLSGKQGWLSPAPSEDFRSLLAEFGVNDPDAHQRLEEFERYERSGELPSDPKDANYPLD